MSRSPHNGRYHSHDNLENGLKEIYDDLTLFSQCSEKGAKDQAKDDDAEGVGAASVSDDPRELLVSEIVVVTRRRWTSLGGGIVTSTKWTLRHVNGVGLRQSFSKGTTMRHWY